jgi:transcriptional regulator with XRE-family HTH domain
VTDLYNHIFFTNVLRLIQELGISKEELAAEAKISNSFLSDITHGNGNPSLRIMAAIAKALDTPLPTLLEQTDLNKEALNELAGGCFLNSLPAGYTRFSAILKTGYELAQVKEWHKKNLDNLRNKHRGKRLTPKKQPERKIREQI